jgi:hypothetical protein
VKKTNITDAHSPRKKTKKDTITPRAWKVLGGGGGGLLGDTFFHRRSVYLSKNVRKNYNK